MPGPWEAAVREAQEEIGLARDHVSLAGYLADHFVISGYIVTPAVAFVRTGFELSSTSPRSTTRSKCRSSSCSTRPITWHARDASAANVPGFDIPYGGTTSGARRPDAVSLYRMLRED